MVNAWVQVGIVDMQMHILSYFVIRCETFIDYIHAHIQLSMDFDSLSRQSNKQTLMRAKICHG